MFLHATEHVINNPSLWESFDFPQEFWTKAKESWNKDKKTIFGRFDFAVNDGVVKCFEYNADSSGAIFECGHVQGKWSQAVGLGSVGTDGGG